MADAFGDFELCPNCKKEIPQCNYVMHTVHCARNIAVCNVCKEPVPKADMQNHLEKHEKAAGRKPQRPASPTRKSTWKHEPEVDVPERLGRVRDADYSAKGAVKKSQTNVTAATTVVLAKPTTANAASAKATAAAAKAAKAAKKKEEACQYCDLQLPANDLQEHEEYCGSRTDKCNICGEFVMFKHKKQHERKSCSAAIYKEEKKCESSWDSSTSRTQESVTSNGSSSRRRRDFSSASLLSGGIYGGSNYDATDYLPSAYVPNAVRERSSKKKMQEQAEYKDMSRRLDCKTEYIKNLLHDSACITAPLRTSATAPRNVFMRNHLESAPMPPPRRRPNPPTELVIPCEFCSVPIPHEDLILHETGCRPDLARYRPRPLARDEDDYDDFYGGAPVGNIGSGGAGNRQAEPSSPEVRLPCEFCADLIPASELLGHQDKCN